MQSYHTIPYHLGRRGLGFATTNSKANSMVAHCACPVGMRRNGRVHPGISGTLQPPLLLAVCVCTVCEGEGGKLKSLVPNILRATPVCWVSLRPCTVELGSIGTYHRFQSLGHRPVPARYILISEYMYALISSHVPSAVCSLSCIQPRTVLLFHLFL